MALFVQLDVNWPDNMKVIRVGLAGAGLHAMALCIAKRTETDGVIHRTQLLRLGADDDLVDDLIEAGLLDVVEFGQHSGEDPDRGYVLRVHDWHDRNPSQGAIAESRTAKMRAARDGNHRRWGHPGAVETCPKCNPPTSARGADNPSVLASDRTRVAPAKRVRSPETETETETYTRDATTKPPKSTPRKTDNREPIYEALVEACGLDYAEMPPTQRRATGVAAAELAKVNATPEQVHARAAAYRAKFPATTMTPHALAKHWATLKAKAQTGRNGPVPTLIIDGVRVQA